MEEKASAEVDMRSLFALFANNWPLFLVFIVGFSLYSVYQISKVTPKFIAVTVFETKDVPQGNQNMVGGLSELSALLPQTLSRPETNIVPKIIGREFLSGYISKYEIKKKLGYKFTSPSVSIFSLAGLLDYFSLYEINYPTKKQSDENFISSLRSMITVKNFRYNNMDTPAYRLEVKHENPEFASFIANTLVEHYFQIERADKRKMFEETLTYLAEIQTVAQVEVENIKKEIDNFILKNSSSLNVDNFENEEVKLDFGKQFQRYNQLETRKRSIDDTIKFLIEAKAKKALSNSDFGSQGQISANYSNNFISEVRKLQQNEKLNVEKNLIAIVDKEIKRLEDLGKLLSKRINDERLLTIANLRLEDEFKSLRLKYLIKKNFSEGLQFNIQDRTVQASTFNLNNNFVHSRATPPVDPAEPNIKMIFVINLLIATFISSFIVLMTQMLRHHIYNLRQIAAIHPFQNMATVSSRQIFSRRQEPIIESIQQSLSINFIDGLSKIGRSLCVVEIGRRGFLQSHLANRVAMFLGIIMGKKLGKQIALIGNQPRLNKSDNFQESFKKSSETKRINGNADPVLIFNSFEKSSLGEKENFFPLKGDLKEFDHILIALGENISETIKYNTILESENYLLVGFKGKFTKADVEKFLINTNSEKQNCVGFILID